MARIEKKTKRYPSDLTDEEWAAMAPFLPQPHRTGRRRCTDLREVLNAIRTMVRSGCEWRMLPVHFPPWQTVYWWFRRFVRPPLFRTIVGSLETTAALRLTPLLAAFIARYPDVDLVLRTGTSCELVEHVLDGRVEGALVCGPVNHPDLTREMIYTEELVLLAAPGVTSIESHLQGRNVRIVVLRAGCSYRLMLEAWLARRGIVGVHQLEFGTLEAIIGCVSAGLGITLLPRALIGGVWREGKVACFPMPGEDGRVETLFIRRQDERASSALTAFMDYIRSPLSRQAAAE
jgi:LysR family transcriptional regulator, cell division regulator